MPLYEYQYRECKLLQEALVFTQPAPSTKPCVKCKGTADKREYPTSIALARSGMDNAPVDNLVGKDSDKRWTILHDRQAKRDAVRKEAGATGLSCIAPGAYVPIPEGQKELRGACSEAISHTGFANAEPVPHKATKP